MELCIVHPGALSAACWTRLASHLPAGTPVSVLELDAINAYWADEPTLTVEAIALRLREELERAPRQARSRVLLGWGFGGVVATALSGRLAEPPRHVVALDALAPGALVNEPDGALLLRWFALYLGARRGRTLTFDPSRLEDGLEPALAHLLEAATRAGALREHTAPATLRSLYIAHARGVLRDHRLTADYVPRGGPLTLVKAASSLLPASPALGWDTFGPVEVLASGGDHYTMLTEPAPAAHLAMLLRRWFAPIREAA